MAAGTHPGGRRVVGLAGVVRRGHVADEVVDPGAGAAPGGRLDAPDLALDRADEENGCVWITQGSQHEPVYPDADATRGHGGDAHLADMVAVSGADDPDERVNDLAAVAAKYPGREVAAVLEPGDSLLELPHGEQAWMPLVSVLPLQLLAYHVAVRAGRDVDQPRNLAKSVTVE